jgi:hypothetical protein
MSIQLTQSQINEYINHGGNKCPFCGAWNITAGDSTFEAAEAWQDVHCEECGKDWVDVFKMVGVEEKK